MPLWLATRTAASYHLKDRWGAQVLQPGLLTMVSLYQVPLCRLWPWHAGTFCRDPVPCATQCLLRAQTSEPRRPGEERRAHSASQEWCPVLQHGSIRGHVEQGSNPPG